MTNSLTKNTNNLSYYVLDVFTTSKYQGNPLAVVVTNNDLPVSAYQDISQEFGYSETSFIQYSEEKNTLHVRSFTPTGFEINGAGHNLLGAVHTVLFNENRFKPNLSEIPKIFMKKKRVPISLSGQKISITQQAATLIATVPAPTIAKAISLSEEKIHKKLKPTVVKTEVSHLMVPIDSEETLHKAKPKKELLKSLADQYGFQGVYCFTLSENNSEVIAETRFFNPGIGIDEDPATGSAAGPLLGLLYKKG